MIKSQLNFQNICTSNTICYLSFYYVLSSGYWLHYRVTVFHTFIVQKRKMVCSVCRFSPHTHMLVFFYVAVFIDVYFMPFIYKICLLSCIYCYPLSSLSCKPHDMFPALDCYESHVLVRNVPC